jgi:hypothetical protein
MLFLIGGIPQPLYSGVISRLVSVLRRDHFVGAPLRLTPQQTYMVDHEYCSDLTETLVAYLEGRRENVAEKGVGVIVLFREWEKPDQFECDFMPFAISEFRKVSITTIKQGEHLRRAINTYADVCIAAIALLRPPINALNLEYERRLRRTPLLLPIDHFASDHLTTLIGNTAAVIKEADIPAAAISAACAQFERHHPFQRSGSGGVFCNSGGVNFKAPGRNAFHGKRPVMLAGEHNEYCFLNARFRLGGYLADGFHYDCTKGDSNYSGRFSTCHLKYDAYRGNPHLNIYSNNFIRGEKTKKATT